MPIKTKVLKLKKGEKIPLMFDGCMKIMFGNNDRLEPLTLLLSRILEIPYEKLEGRIEVVSSKVSNKHLVEKKTDRDIVVRLISDKNQRIIIEVNVKPRKYDTVINKNIYYLNEVFTSGLNESESYNNIENTFLINFNTFYTDNIHKKIFDYYYLMNEEGNILTEKQKILNINIARCYQEWYTKSERDFRNSYERDLFYLCAAMVTEKEDEFKECLSKLNTSLSLKELIEKVMSDMEDKDDLKLDYYNFLEETKRINDGIIEEEKEKAREIGLKEGREKGRVEGHAEGRAEGRAEGLREGIEQNRKEMIINLNNNNVPVDIIAKSADLQVNEVRKIIDKNSIS